LSTYVTFTWVVRSVRPMAHALPLVIVDVLGVAETVLCPHCVALCGGGTVAVAAQRWWRHSSGGGTAVVKAQRWWRHSGGGGTAVVAAQRWWRHSGGGGTAVVAAQ
jgi:hypothetical protein